VVIHVVESGESQPATLHVRCAALLGATDIACKLLTPTAYDREDHEAAATSGKYETLRRVVTLKPTAKDGMLIVELPAVTPWSVLVIAPAT